MRGARWTETQNALIGITGHASKYTTTGVDMYFLNSTEELLRAKVRKLFVLKVPANNDLAQGTKVVVDTFTSVKPSGTNLQTLLAIR
jgi:hypothetical protein